MCSGNIICSYPAEGFHLIRTQGMEVIADQTAGIYKFLQIVKLCTLYPSADLLDIPARVEFPYYGCSKLIPVRW